LAQCANVAPMSQSDLIGTATASTILGWSRAKVKREAKGGQLAPLVVSKLTGDTGAYLFNRSDVERLAGEVAA
jgi:hypothetical protein